jgi:uncharacterized protein
MLLAPLLIVAMTPQTRPALKAEPFPLSQVKLTSGPFQHAEKLTSAYLLELDSDRLLHSFRKNSGLEPKGAIYGGWENSGLAGHTLGHYLTACAQEFAGTGDKRFKDKIDYIVDELAACQASRPDGCISAIPNGDKVWEELRKGEIRSKGFDLNGLWSPWYTHHKVLAGLLDANRLAGNKKALEVASRFADWAIDLTKNFTDAQWQQMLGTEYGGMNDALAELSAETGQGKYLALARKFYDRKVLDALAEGKDELAGKHSNTQVPKLIGLARLYELTGDAKARKQAEFFWGAVVRHHTYAIGGNSDHEYLGPPDQLSEHLSTNTAETCNTYNMLKLTRHLFSWEPRAEYADYYERAHINHILASQNPETGMMTYFMPLASGARKQFSNKTNNFTCCHGSGLENHTKHADSVYFHSGIERLWVNLFVPSELDWREAGLKLRQETQFPADSKVSLTIEQAPAKEMEIAVRHPGWAKGELSLLVNGKSAAKSKKPASYVILKRKWKAGDRIELTLPMALWTEAMPDNPKRVAVLYGPVVLAADMGRRQTDFPRMPVLVTGDRPMTTWLQAVPGEPLAFRTAGSGRPADFTLRPFYALYDKRHAVYFDEFTEEGWRAEEAAYRAEEARVKDLEARTVDSIRIGEMQPERDHDLKAEKTDRREANGRGWRTPLPGGWFECRMAVDPEMANELVVTYWGLHRTKPNFEVLVDGKRVVLEELPNRKVDQFFDVAYALPEESTKGKAGVIVRFQASPGQSGAPVAGLRTVRRRNP